MIYKIRIIIGALFFASAFLFETAELPLFVVSYLILGYDVIIKAARNIVRGRMFDENFLMAAATLGAFAIGEYPEGVAVMLFYQIGELFQRMAVGRSRRSISALMDIQPEYANLEIGAEMKKVDPSDVKINDIIIVKPGEKVPLDGIVMTGNSTVDTSALTGESVPRNVSEGDQMISGSVNISGMLKMIVTKEYSDSTVSRILELVEEASGRKSTQERFITRFARYYTPAVVLAALLIAIMPPVITGAELNEWIYRALVFLVVSCPCALVISVPLTFFGGIGGASRNGILIKGGNFIETLAKTDTVIFDKTGTLTRGVFNVYDIRPVDIDKRDLLRMAAHAEAFSDHPIAVSVREAYGKGLDHSLITDVTEIPGQGVKANVSGHEITIGSSRLVRIPEGHSVDVKDTIVHVSVDGVYSGYMLIADEIKGDSYNVSKELKKEGVKRIVMLTGDLKDVGEKVAKELGIEEVYTEMLPQDKVNVTEMMSAEGKNVAFVGDGVNDAPALARADTGIAMGALGSDAAIEAADVVIMTDEPSKVPEAIRISKRTLSIAKQNIFLALSIKAVVMFLGLIGVATMWEAVFADVGVSVLAILNAMRALSMPGSVHSANTFQRMEISKDDNRL